MKRILLRFWIIATMALGLSHCCRCDKGAGRPLNWVGGKPVYDKDGKRSYTACFHQPLIFCASCEVWFEEKASEKFSNLGNALKSRLKAAVEHGEIESAIVDRSDNRIEISVNP
jgi:hypothetical protein